MFKTEDGVIWKQPVDLEALNAFEEKGMPGYVGIEIVEIGPNFLRGTMPVDHRTKQPFGILHGGASVVLAETLGSLAGNLCLEKGEGHCVGLDINSNHIRSVSEGIVVGTTRPYHIGRSTQVWDIEIHNEAGKLVNVSRLTLAVLTA